MWGARQGCGLLGWQPRPDGYQQALHSLCRFSLQARDQDQKGLGCICSLRSCIRVAAENVALSGEITRLREYVEGGERETLMADVDILRGELLRVTESLERLQALPQVQGIGFMRLPGHLKKKLARF